MQQYPSALLQRAVDEFSRLPGIGSKTALRLVLNLLKQPEESVEHFTSAITHLRKDIKYCSVCHNISDTDVCSICSDSHRDHGLVCVVENVQDVMASPMEGVGPGDLQIASLVERVAKGGIREVILALSSTMEGDTTSFYISRQLKPYPVKLSVISRGISVGNELEYTDEVTLGRSIVSRTPLDKS